MASFLLLRRLPSTRGDAMPLNIRNKQAEELAGALAKLTGETKTEAVTQALRERPSESGGSVQSADWSMNSTKSPFNARISHCRMHVGRGRDPRLRRAFGSKHCRAPSTDCHDPHQSHGAPRRRQRVHGLASGLTLSPSSYLGQFHSGRPHISHRAPRRRQRIANATRSLQHTPRVRTPAQFPE